MAAGLFSKRYEIVKSLGQGAQGEVVLARDGRLGGRLVAIKTLHSDKGGEDWLAYFKREFEILADLSHPRLARVYDFGKTGDGQVFFSRDYISGLDLMAGTSGASTRSIVHAAVEICRALRPLHQRGMLHGDIKPSNIILDDGGMAHLIDFSFVRNSGKTALHDVSGTIQYMAPEILENGVVDVRADLYSLGVTFFELLSGEPLFEGTTQEVVSNHLSILRPSVGFTRVSQFNGFDEAMATGMGKIVAKLISRPPESRLPDVDEVEAALIALDPAFNFKDPIVSLPALTSVAGRDEEVSRAFESVIARFETPLENKALYVVEGEVGTGTKAVVESVKWRIQLKGISVISADCEGGGGLFDPVISLVEQLVELVDQDTPDTVIGQNLLSTFDGFGEGNVDLAGLGVQVGRLLVKAAAFGPLLVIVGDVELATRETLVILKGVLAQIAGDVPVAVLVSSLAGNPWQEHLGRGQGVVLPLLDESQVAALLKTYFGKSEKDCVARILAHTGGNPLFVSTLLNDLVRCGEGLERLERLGPPVALESYWRSKLAQLSPRQLALIEGFAVIGRPTTAGRLSTLVSYSSSEIQAEVATLQAAGWLKSGADGYHLATLPLVREILSAMEPDVSKRLHKLALLEEPDEGKQILFAVAAGDVDSVKVKGVQVAEQLEKRGALYAAKEILVAIHNASAGGLGFESVDLALGRVLLAQGDQDGARSYLEPLVDHSEVGRRALLLLGRMHQLRNELDAAADFLNRAKALDGTSADTAKIYCELANVAFSKGDHAGVEKVVEHGFFHAPAKSTVLADLWCVLGKTAVLQGDHDKALSCCQQAVAKATDSGERRSMAYAINMTSWVLQQSGDLAGATNHLKKAAEIYREMGDFARLMMALSALGDCCWWLERFGQMLEYYEEAMRLSGAVGNPVQRMEVKIHLGQALAKVGRFERAALILKEAKEDAEKLGLQKSCLQIATFEGDVQAWQGKVDKALSIWEGAIAQLEAMDLPDFCAERELEMAEFHLWRGKAADKEAARKLIKRAEARKRVELGRRFDDLQALQKGTLAFADQKFDEGTAIIEQLIESLEKREVYDLTWQAHLVIAKAHVDRGASLLARKRLRTAERLLEKLAADLPSEHLLAFWQDVRRAEVRRLLTITVPSSSISTIGDFISAVPVQKSDSEAARLYRVLELNKQLSTQRNLDQLLEDILDAAIELTGAERGFVLVPKDSNFEVQVARENNAERANELHEQFSKSIAESVYLDGEPVVTIDAMGDDRFNEFLSIHALNIRSVACLPVAFRGQCYGVLYLENRLRRGRFDGTDLKVLSAFSVQVAIAVFQAKLLEEAEEKNKKLEEATRELKALCSRQAVDLQTNKTDLRLTQDRLERIKNRVEGEGNYRGVIGTCDSMRRAFNVVERAKDLNVPVVIVGESGTGKDLLARVIHDAGSRARGPYVPVSCGGIPENLVESSLFGHTKGAFSGADNDQPGLLSVSYGGTLYLDNLEEMSPRMQVVLLRVLQEGSFVPLGGSRSQKADFRLVVSSKVPLEELEKQGILREDLLYRLKVLTIDLPPLRERKEDIPLLAKSILQREAVKLQKQFKFFSSEAVAAMAAKSWPGNVREMEQVIRRAMIVSDDTEMMTQELLFGETQPIATTFEKAKRGRPSVVVAQDEEKQILDALEKCQWNRSKAAEMLGIPRRTFYRRLEKLGVVKK